MDRDFIVTSIKSYEARRKAAGARAINAINDGSYLVALVAITDAMKESACIEELEFQLEDMEVHHD